MSLLVTAPVTLISMAANITENTIPTTGGIWADQVIDLVTAREAMTAAKGRITHPEFTFSPVTKTNLPRLSAQFMSSTVYTEAM